MRMRIDEARRHNQVGRVDRLLRALVDLADLDDLAAAIATSARRAGPPVPSTTVPFLIRRSNDIRRFLLLAPGEAIEWTAFIFGEQGKAVDPLR